MDYRLDLAADEARVPAAVRRGIAQNDPADVGPRDWMTICLAFRNAEDAVVGGLYGATMWRWLLIDGLWVDAALRDQGLGSQLLLAAEEIAVQRGCVGSLLNTFDFQARDFYERHGYTALSELTGFPSGHTQYRLHKLFP